MFSLKSLRILIILNLLTTIGCAVTGQYYDPTISPLIDQIDQIMFDSISNFNAIVLLIILFLYTIALIYSSIALWIAHRTGKWVFLASIILTVVCNFFIKIFAVSGLTVGLSDLSMLFSGMILAIIFSNSKKTV